MTTYFLYLHILTADLQKEKRIIYFHRIPDLKKPTDEAAELTIEVICSLEGLINHTEVRTLIAVSSPLEFTQTRLSSVSKMLLPVHINSITMTQPSELVLGSVLCQHSCASLFLLAIIGLTTSSDLTHSSLFHAAMARLEINFFFFKLKIDQIYYTLFISEVLRGQIPIQLCAVNCLAFKNQLFLTV